MSQMVFIIVTERTMSSMDRGHDPLRGLTLSKFSSGSGS